MDTPDAYTAASSRLNCAATPMHDHLRYEQGVKKIVIGFISRLLCGVLLATVLILVAGCESTAERQAAQRAHTEKQAAAEVDRICALPTDQREAELKKIQKESGVVLVCP